MKWISVKDKVPTSINPVLATDGKKHEIVEFENGHWHGKTSEYGFLMILKCVSHWMPLPEPPKE